MKKFITLLSILLLLLFNVSTVITVAQPTDPTRFKEGFYNINNLGLMENISYKIENISDFNGFLIVFDSDQKVQQAISLEPHSQKYPLKPIRNSDRVVILGQGELTFSS